MQKVQLKNYCFSKLKCKHLMMAQKIWQHLSENDPIMHIYTIGLITNTEPLHGWSIRRRVICIQLTFTT